MSDEEIPVISVANHPRSSVFVRRAKGWGGLVGVMLAAFFAWRADLPAGDVLVRALAGGVTGFIVVWGIAVAVARQLVIAEVRAKAAEILAREEEKDLSPAPVVDAQPV